MLLSANRFLCLTRAERAASAGPVASAPVFVFMKKYACASARQSLRSVSSHLCSASNRPVLSSAPCTSRYSMLIYLHLFPAHRCHLSQRTLSIFGPASLSYNLLLFSRPLCLSAYSFSSRHILPVLSPLLFSCQSPSTYPPTPPPLCSPPSLTPQLGSTMRWQWQGCGVVRCVCLCDVTLQQLYGSSLFFNPHAHRPHCYFKIL